MSEATIESVSHEHRVFPPTEEFSKRALIGTREEYEALYRRSIEDPEGFWAEQAQALHWFTPPQKTVEWKAPFSKWFVGGTTNLAYN